MLPNVLGSHGTPPKPPEATRFEQVVTRLLAQRAGPSPSAASVNAAAQALHDELAAVCAPLIGQLGFNALAGRALHLARREHECFREAASHHTFGEVVACLGAQSPDAAAAAATAVLVGVMVLLTTFIGETVTAGVLRRAWPDGFAHPTVEGM